MKKILGCFLFIMNIVAASSQIFYVETGKIASSFLYKDSKGNLLENLNGSNHNNMGLGMRFSVNQSNFHISGRASYNRYGAMGSNPVLGNYYEWDVTYLGANIDFDYEFLRPSVSYNEQHGFSFYPKISLATEFLLNGNQNLNDQIYDLSNQEEFDKPLYFLRGGVGVNYYISKTFILFAEYVGGKSFLVGNYANKEQLRLITHNVSVGLAINLQHLM